MYSLNNATCLSRSMGSQWKVQDISNIPVFQLYQNFVKVYMTVHNSVTNTDSYVDLDTLKTLYANYQNTLPILLAELKNQTLTTVASLPTTKVAFAKYSDAIRSNYKIELCKIGTVYPENYPELEKPDLKMTRSVVTTIMQQVHDYCLVSVNGYYHMTDADAQAAYVNQGAVTMRRSRNNHLGILSFQSIGKLEKIKLDPNAIHPSVEGGSLKDKLTFTVPNDLQNKSYILILGGYMVFPQENVFWLSDDQSFTLNLAQLPYIERILESNKYLDLSSLNLSIPSNNHQAYNVDEVLSDEVIRKYMTLSQSYLVTVDIPHLLTNKVHLRHSVTPGMFTAYQEPVYPLIVTYGKVGEYWKTQEDQFWSVTLQDSYLRNYIVSQQPVKPHIEVTDNLSPVRPFYHGRGFLLEISGYKNY